MTNLATFSHVGLTVPDLDRAVSFYADAFGCYVLMPPTRVESDDSAIGIMCRDVFGDDVGAFRIAQLSLGDGIGLELFEFPGTRRPEQNFAFRTVSLTHFCLQHPDLETALERVVALGGRQRMPVRSYFPGEKPYRMVYVEDPFGNVFELYSHSYELTYASGAYQDATTPNGPR